MSKLEYGDDDYDDVNRIDDGNFEDDDDDDNHKIRNE